MKRFLALALFLLCSMAAAQTTAVTGTGIQDGSGNLLGSGTWCFASTCLSVSNGAFSGTVTSGTQTVTVVNGSSATILTVPNVLVSGLSFNWNQP